LLTGSAVLVALLLAACDGDGGRGDLADGKVFDASAVKSCLRDAGFRIEPQVTDTGIDFTVRWRSGANNADVAVERAPGDAEAREGEWRQLAEQAGIENAGDYYFRYGNVLLGYARLPGEADRARIERCLT
jgi:hypothetical protein